MKDVFKKFFETVFFDPVSLFVSFCIFCIMCLMGSCTVSEMISMFK